MDILYEELPVPTDDVLLEVPEGEETIKFADESTFLFMHDNALCHKTQDVAALIGEHNFC
jgi:hypothetical protein